MDAHVPGQVLDLVGQVDDLLGNIVDVGRLRAPVADLLAPRVLLPLREAQGTSHVADGDPRTIGDHVGDLSRVVAAVLVIDVLDDLLPLIRLDVDVDIGRPVADR